MDMQPQTHPMQDSGQSQAAPPRPATEPVFDLAAFAALARFAGIPPAGQGGTAGPR